MKTKLKSIKVNSFILIILLFTLTSCYTKPQSLKIIETIKENIEQTELKVKILDKEYKQLIAEKPECKNEIIIENIESIKADISNLYSRTTIAEYMIKTETKSCQNEIKTTKTTNFLLKTLLILLSIGFTFLLTKLRK